MKRAVIADTGPLFASADPDDAHHKLAQQELRRLDREKREVVVAYPALLQAYTLVLFRLGKIADSLWLKQMSNASLINPGPEDYRQATAKVQTLPDQPVTLFDAVTVALAARLELEVWTYDHHFDLMHVAGMAIGLLCPPHQKSVRAVFSGDETFEKNINRFSTHVAAILLEEGFTVHFRKTRVMRQGVRQHLAGLVVNQHANVMRSDFDRLKATLTNCVRLGAKSQNREGHTDFRSHLEGRVGFVEMVNPTKGVRLRRIFEQIQW